MLAGVSALLTDLEASFRRELRAAGKAPRTGAVYAQSIAAFVAWLAEQGRPATLDQLTRDAVRRWLAELAGRVAPNTLRTRYRSLFRFCGWLTAEGELAVNPMAGLEVPPVVAPSVPVLTDDELTALIRACQGPRWYDRRDEALVRMLLDTGVRVSELCGITVDTIDLNHETALVMGKGARPRAVYYGARTARALDRWMRARRTHKWNREPALFLGERGPLTPDGVREVLAVRGAAAGITGRLHPHRFRHTFAHDFLLNGGQERDLKRLAGWTSDVMLERYGASAADMRAREAARRLRRGDRV